MTTWLSRSKLSALSLIVCTSIIMSLLKYFKPATVTADKTDAELPQEASSKHRCHRHQQDRQIGNGSTKLLRGSGISSPLGRRRLPGSSGISQFMLCFVVFVEKTPRMQTIKARFILGQIPFGRAVFKLMTSPRPTQSVYLPREPRKIHEAQQWERLLEK